uniref:RING-type domain-containing protein n=1 Tax=Plectus sambesii TaxID=2011161 RepID=A0A914V487_9BILA
MVDGFDDLEGLDDSLREDIAVITEVLGGQVQRERVKEQVKLMKNTPNRRQAVIEVLLNLQDEMPESSQQKSNGALKRSSSAEISETESPAKRARVSNGSTASAYESETSDGVNGADAVLIAVQEITDRFPDCDPNLVYNRLADATDLTVARDALIQELLPPDDAEERSMAQPPRVDKIDDADVPSTSRVAVANFLSVEEQDALRHITNIFPDVDPHFVVEKLAQQQWQADQLIQHMTTESYPKLRARILKERRDRRRQEFLSEHLFDVADFLIVFNEPETYFTDQTRAVSQLYINHCNVYLMNSYPNMHEVYLMRILGEHNNHLLPTIRALEGADDQEEIARSSPRGRRGRRNSTNGPARGQTPAALRRKSRPRKQRVQNHEIFLPVGQDRLQPLPWPDEIDENFFRELQYYTNKHLIEEHLARKRDDRQRRIEAARAANDLEECACCFCDDNLPEDMVACESGAHKFCRGCVVQHANTQVGDGGHVVKCMDGGCKGEMTLKALRPLLRPQVVDLILRRSQQAELRSAQLDNMETCPFCDFALIIENADERLFRCQNPDCLKESCRECKEQSHIPLRCEEVEKDVEVRMRTFIENRMAEAMIRICPQCNQRIIKSDGCNKMTCSCGAYICYVCRELLPKRDPYGHFAVARADGKKPCAQDTPMKQLHDEAAQKAGEEARLKFMNENPTLNNIKDVDISKLTGGRGRGRGLGRHLPVNHRWMFGGEDNFLEDDDDYDMDDYDEDDSDSDRGYQQHREYAPQPPRDFQQMPPRNRAWGEGAGGAYILSLSPLATPVE